MIKQFIKAWDANKDKLKEYISTHPIEDSSTYEQLLTSLFKYVINPYFAQEADMNEYNLDKIHRIDDGDYQGTLVFLIPENVYQPMLIHYVMTGVEYGSCSYCDVLQGIIYGSELEDKPSDGRTNSLMKLCLHMLQRCKIPYCNEEE